PPYVLLQDYHLYLAPATIRRELPEATILHFTHIPWPGPRYWGLLPEFMRRRIHADMCAADVVGLQTLGDVRNFLHCCDAMLLAAPAGAVSGVPAQGALHPVPGALAQRAGHLPDIHGRDLRDRRIDQRPLR